MKLLKNLIGIKESSDLSRLPQDVMTAIKSNIRKGANDLQQNWANALELVHKAFEIEGAQRPTPDMDAAWKQYEECLVYAVQQLATNRGMDADWRMSSSIFHEAQQPKQKFRVQFSNDEQLITESDTAETLINKLKHHVSDHDVHIVQENDNIHMSFSKWGIKHTTHITITQM